MLSPSMEFNTIAAIFCICSFLSVLFHSVKTLSSREKPWRVPIWIPLEGYLASTVINSDGMAQKVICYLFTAGRSTFGLTTKHSVIHNPHDVRNVLRQPHQINNNDRILWNLLVKVFGNDDRRKNQFFNAQKELDRALTSNLLSEEPVAKAIQVTVDLLHQLGPAVVSFSPDKAKLMPWEETASTQLLTGNKSVEVSLFPLIRKFVGHVALPSLMGTRFLEINPTVLDDLWLLDAAFTLIVIGIPTWLPVATMRAVKPAQGRLNKAMANCYAEIEGDESINSSGVEDVSQAMKQRNKVYREHGFAVEDRAPLDIGLLWAFNANANSLVFWIILHILATQGLLESVRKEIDPFSLPPSPLNKTTPALVLNTQGVLRSCPILKACYFESLRLNHEPTSLRHVLKDFTIQPPPSRSATPYTVKAGSFITMPHSINQYDPAQYPNPTVFDHTRFLHLDQETGRLVARQGVLKPWGGGLPMCKGRVFAEREVLLIVASVLALWDFEPVEEGEWKVPGMIKGTGVNMPKGDLKARVRRRVI